MLDLRCADAESQRAERAVRAGVAVTANDGHAGLGKSQLGSDDVHDAAVFRSHVEQLNAELAAVLAQRLPSALRRSARGWERERRGRDVVVDGGDGAFRPAHLAARGAQALEGLRRGDLVNQVQVDIKQRRLVGGFAHYVASQSFSKSVRGLDMRV